MKLISHRGNINGQILELENTMGYIDIAIANGYDVEIDVWYKDDILYLGHDHPQDSIDLEWLLARSSNLWCHAKNGEALYYMSQHNDIHYFWHQDDKFTLTSEGFIWTYPKKSLYYNSICVLPELGYEGEFNCYGICSDYIERYK